MKQIKVLSLCMVAVAAVMMVTSYGVSSSIKAGDITGGKKAPHVNVAIFHKLHGQEGFNYPAHMADHDILHTMQGKAQFISINHTAGLMDGDILAIGNDVLREGADSAFEDFGVDCQLNIHIKANGVSLAGLCQVLMVDQSGREIEHKAIIKPTTMEAGKGWVLLYNDAEDGIAIYADEEVGLE
ncbi:MAG: hypothetical protein Q9M09_02230 [Mariprofundaceae bacterium]|nr:hypothetical protein [Mariprofundaceae bacterium]